MKLKFLIIGILVIASAFSLWFFRNQRSLVKVNLKVGDIVESIYGLGTVTPDEIYHVRGGMTLWLRQLFVKEGDQVAKGSPLVKLEETIIRSPIEGTVTQVDFKEGEVVTPQVPVVTVINLKKLYLEVNLEQQSILRIKPNQKAFISFENLRNQKSEGVVRSVFPKSNQFVVRIELAAWPEGVLPGMTADVAILVGAKQNALLIPLKAVSAGKVIRVNNGKREKIPVQLGVVDGEWAEVTSGNLSITDELLMKRE